MTKPASVAAQELYDKMVFIMEESGLPAFVVYGILCELSAEVKKLATNQYNADVVAYQQAIAEEQNKPKEEEHNG